MEQPGGTDAELWDRCIHGEAEALGGLFDRYADAVFRYCLSRTGSWQDAEDLVSITYLEAWRQRSRLVLERDSLLPRAAAAVSPLLRREQNNPVESRQP